MIHCDLESKLLSYTKLSSLGPFNGVTDFEEANLKYIHVNFKNVHSIISHIGLICEGNFTGVSRLGRK